MFYSTLCLKVGAYFQNIFELNTAKHKLLGFTIPHLEADSGDQNRANGISCKANLHSFHIFFIMIRIRDYRACFILHRGVYRYCIVVPVFCTGIPCCC